MKIIVVLICFVFFVGGKVHGATCRRRADHLSCECRPNESIEVLYEGSHTITSLNVASCDSAELPNYMGPELDKTITSIKVENIKNKLTFCPTLYSENLTKIELFDIGYLPEIDSSCLSPLFARLDHFHIRNTFIENFQPIFHAVEVKVFILRNVVIANFKGPGNFSQKGSKFLIIDSYLNVTEKSLIFENFENISIINTMIEFPDKGNISISGTHINLSNNTFLNASVNVMGNESIHLVDTCADGPGSAMRLHSLEGHRIVSHRNKLPTPIIYVPGQKHDNIICPNAKCNCPLHKRVSVGPINYGRTIHQETSRVFFLSFIIIVSAIVARI